MTARKCGDCQLCCRVMPVRELAKPENTRCKHQRFGKGCLVHGKPAMPRSCSLWSCLWLAHPDDTCDLSRPDRSGYVVDLAMEYITQRDDATGAVNHVPCVQVWLDPARPTAHRDPALRTYLAKRAGEDGFVALIRSSATSGFVLVAPCLNSDGAWLEISGETGPSHSAEDIAEALGDVMTNYYQRALAPDILAPETPA